MVNKDLNLSKDIFNANIKLMSTRQGFGDSVVKLAERIEDIVVLTADLEESIRVSKFADKFPERFIEVGIAEQNMAGIGAGLALSGKIPFITSFAVFNPGRNWGQIRLEMCYSKANVKIVGSHSGFSDGPDGATHQALEDIALTRVLPNMVVLSPADYEQTKKAIKEAVKVEGPVYIRLTRHKSPSFTTSSTPFAFGKPQILRKGKNITLIGTGPIVYEALLAAHELHLRHRLEVEVINVHTIKPLKDTEIIKSASKTNFVITLEEHQTNGGLGGAVAELLSEKQPTYVHRLGAKDTFGESGSYRDLIDKHKLSSKHLVRKILNLYKEAHGKPQKK